MSYDTSTNRELAKTALAIYQKHTIKENVNSGYGNQTLTESNNYAQRRGAPTNLKEAVEDVLLEYASDVVLTAEMNIGKKLNENEINNVAGRLLEYINILPANQQVTLMQELSSLYEGDYFQTPTDQSGYVLPAQDAPTGGGITPHTKPGNAAAVGNPIRGIAQLGGPQTGVRPGGAGFNPNTQILPPTGLPNMEPPYGGSGRRQGVPVAGNANASGAAVGRNFDALAGRRQGVPTAKGTNTQARTKRNRG
jgi:hypothetical protein